MGCICTCCRCLRDDFDLSNIPTHVFYHSQWEDCEEPSVMYLVYRLIFMFLSVSSLMYGTICTHDLAYLFFGNWFIYLDAMYGLLYVVYIVWRQSGYFLERGRRKRKVASEKSSSRKKANMSLQPSSSKTEEPLIKMEFIDRKTGAKLDWLNPGSSSSSTGSSTSGRKSRSKSKSKPKKKKDSKDKYVSQSASTFMRKPKKGGGAAVKPHTKNRPRTASGSSLESTGVTTTPTDGSNRTSISINPTKKNARSNSTASVASSTGSARANTNKIGRSSVSSVASVTDLRSLPTATAGGPAPSPGAAAGASTPINYYAAPTCVEKLLWIIINIVHTVSYIVSTIYWVFLVQDTHYKRPCSKIRDYSLVLVAPVMMLVDTFMTAVPTRLTHFIFPALYSASYCLFSYIYEIAGGRYVVVDKKEKEFIYPVLNWRHDPEYALYFSLGATASIALCHTVTCWGFYKLAILFTRYCCLIKWKSYRSRHNLKEEARKRNQKESQPPPPPPPPSPPPPLNV